MTDMPPFPPNDSQRQSPPPNFASGPFFQSPAPPPPKNRGEASVVNRTALWVLLSTLAGMATPICLCVCLCMGSFVGLSTWAGQLDTTEETGPAVGVIDLTGPIIGGDSLFSASTGYMQEQIK